MTPRVPITYLTPEKSRPSRGTLSEAIGFKVPARFADFVCQLHDYCGGDPESCLDAFDAALGLFPAGQDARYWGTPPELFPVGNTGCDGDHYGFLLHAPELDLDDLPYCHYCPMDSDGVILVGSATEQGIASVMAGRLSYDFESAEKKQFIADVARACNICPNEEEHPSFSIPEGWRFLPSSDGVGTLAPAELFSSQPLQDFDRYGPPEPFINAATLAARNGHLATALHYLREGLWFCWATKPFGLAWQMASIYQMLNRAQLAEELNRTMKRWGEAAT